MDPHPVVPLRSRPGLQGQPRIDFRGLADRPGFGDRDFPALERIEDFDTRVVVGEYLAVRCALLAHRHGTPLAHPDAVAVHVRIGGRARHGTAVGHASAPYILRVSSVTVAVAEVEGVDDLVAIGRDHPLCLLDGLVRLREVLRRPDLAVDGGADVRLSLPVTRVQGSVASVGPGRHGLSLQGFQMGSGAHLLGHYTLEVLLGLQHHHRAVRHQNAKPLGEFWESEPLVLGEAAEGRC